MHTNNTGFPGGSVVKNPPVNAGDARDAGFIPGSGRFLGVGSGNPLKNSCLQNPIIKETGQIHHLIVGLPWWLRQ